MSPSGLCAAQYCILLARDETEQKTIVVEDVCILHRRDASLSLCVRVNIRIMRRSLSKKEACSPTETSPKSHKEPKEFHRRTNRSLPSVSSNIFERFRVLYRSHEIVPLQSRIYTNSYVIQQPFPRGHARRFLHNCELVTELSPLNMGVHLVAC